ncbi:hypothetical protein GWI33_010897 [Rhynchophorus ferrugineus]|uniref:Uncharacterized protein n=1 Tax=Rhynchophorus ferrugineus TaxID=354439 RepID=A0A834IBT8_RHYFE|nr:hypothetical protein GWI33_010897 [Rhynchophorus ferrugineus]
MGSIPMNKNRSSDNVVVSPTVSSLILGRIFSWPTPGPRLRSAIPKKRESKQSTKTIEMRFLVVANGRRPRSKMTFFADSPPAPGPNFGRNSREEFLCSGGRSNCCRTSSRINHSVSRSARTGETTLELDPVDGTWLMLTEPP